MKCDFPTSSLEELMYYSALFTLGDYTPVPQLYHYTLTENKDKICQERNLDFRFTQASRFSDKEETRHFSKFLCEQFKQLHDDGRIDGQFYKVLCRALDETDNITEELKKLYVLCFSKEGNHPYLKEHYACKNGKPGSIIGVQTYEFDNIEDVVRHRDDPTAFFTLYDVLYDEKELAGCIVNIVLQAYSLRDQDNADYKLTRRIVHGLVWSYGLVHKGPEFAEEKETRLVVHEDIINYCDEAFKRDPDGYIHMLLPKSAICCDIPVQEIADKLNDMTHGMTASERQIG